MGIKDAEFYADFKFFDASFKKYSYKETFLVIFLKSLSTNIKSARRSPFFDTLIDFFCQNNFAILGGHIITFCRLYADAKKPHKFPNIWPPTVQFDEGKHNVLGNRPNITNIVESSEPQVKQASIYHTSYRSPFVPNNLFAGEGTPSL